MANENQVPNEAATETQSLADLFAVTETELTVRLKNGVTAYFRATKDSDEYTAIGERAEKLAKAVSEGRIAEAWRPFLPISRRTIMMVEWIHSLQARWTVGGKQVPNQTHIDLLQLSKTGGAMVPYLYSQLLAFAGQVAAEQEEEELDTLMGS